MTEKSIETRIREHYQSDNGEWLVEKNKVKEARLLKEACETIESLRRENTNLWTSNLKHSRDYSDKLKELESREKKIVQQEEQLEHRLRSVMQSIEYMLKNESR